jgi:FMN phosphatase YigB (HAD superfamily)
MNHIKLIAVNLESVLLKDNYSPVIRKILMRSGKNYNDEIERTILSHSRQEAIRYLLKLPKHDIKINEFIRQFSSERENFGNTNGIKINETTLPLIELLKRQNAKLICYGSLSDEYFNMQLENLKPYFDRYISTNDFKPMIKEIVKDNYKLDFSEVLFIDDINTVAATAKELNVPFIGCPLNNEWEFQKKEMEKTGVKYMVDSIAQITQEYLEKIDADASKGNSWSLFQRNESKTIRGFFIDFDGVISKKAVHVLIEFASEYINSFTPIPPAILKEYIKIVTAFPLAEAVGLLMKAIGLSDKTNEFLLKCRDLTNFNNENIGIDSDFIRFIDFCEENELKYFILSMADSSSTRLKMLQAAIGNDHILSVNNRSKSDPEMFTSLTKEMLLDPAEWYVVDDSPLALRSASLAGVNTIMMLNDVFTEDDYLIFKDFINYKVNSFDELKIISSDLINRESGIQKVSVRS